MEPRTKRLARHPKADEYEAVKALDWDSLSEEHLVSEMMADKYLKRLRSKYSATQLSVQGVPTSEPGNFIFKMRMVCPGWAHAAHAEADDRDYPNGDAYIQCVIKLAAMATALELTK